MSNDDILKWEDSLLLKNVSNLPIQSVSPSNSLFFEGVEIILDHLEQYSVLEDDRFLHQSPLWRMRVNDTEVIVIKEDAEIKHISVKSVDKKADFFPVPFSEGAKSSGQFFATITPGDYDPDRLMNMRKSGEDSEVPLTLQKEAKKMNYGLDDIDSSIQLARNDGTRCDSYQVVRAVIAFDSSLCKEFRGQERAVMRHIQSIIGLGSSYFESMCLKIKIPFIDGTCDLSQDPYRDTAKSSNVLEDFTAQFRKTRPVVRKDTAHLFSGTPFPNGVLGWAWKGGICTSTHGYGANYMTFSDNIALRASLFGEYFIISRNFYW